MTSHNHHGTADNGDIDKHPAHHANNTKSAFKNPWVKPKGLVASGQVLASHFPLEIAQKREGIEIQPIKVINPTFGRDKDKSTIKATWLGHAGYLVELPSFDDASSTPTRILFDPIWSERASPIAYAGPKRRLPPPCAIEDLPEIHFVVTSHNHYDHLDLHTIKRVSDLHGPNVHFIAPLGNKSWFEDSGISSEQVTHMDWGDEKVFKPPNGGPPVTFICTPSQHNSGRGIFDQGTTLWSSWVIKQTSATSTVSVYHAGDTGYMTESGPSPCFVEIGQKYGPFDVAMLPIWRGGSLSFIAAAGLRLANTELLDGLHASPAHAVQLHADIRSRHTLAMHFATFAGSDLEALEPLIELVEARKATGIGDWPDEGGFGWLDIGATACIPTKGS